MAASATSAAPTVEVGACRSVLGVVDDLYLLDHQRTTEQAHLVHPPMNPRVLKHHNAIPRQLLRIFRVKRTDIDAIVHHAGKAAAVTSIVVTEGCDGAEPILPSALA